MCETHVGYNCTKSSPKMDKVSSQSCLIDVLYFSLHVWNDDAPPESSASDGRHSDNRTITTSTASPKGSKRCGWAGRVQTVAGAAR